MKKVEESDGNQCQWGAVNLQQGRREPGRAGQGPEEPGRSIKAGQGQEGSARAKDGVRNPNRARQSPPEPARAPKEPQGLASLRCVSQKWKNPFVDQEQMEKVQKNMWKTLKTLKHVKTRENTETPMDSKA